MAGYYFMDAPNLSVRGESRHEALQTAELRAVLSCLLRAHADALTLNEADAQPQRTVFESVIPCVERYEISTIKLCADGTRMAAACIPDRVDRTVQNFIITRTGIISQNGAGRVLDILAEDHPHASNFGIIVIENRVPHILSSGGARREVPRALVRDAAFQDGELVYITQYSVTGRRNLVIAAQAARIRCGPMERLIQRQGRWTCASANIQRVCSGHNMWDPFRGECVPDLSRRPLCDQGMTAVMIDGMWECVLPAEVRNCPPGQSAQLNHDTLEWSCVRNNPEEEGAAQRCRMFFEEIVGGGTMSMRGSLVSCNDCERMIVADDCTAVCVPDPAAINRRSCYSGNCRDFYFGFPDARYLENAKRNIPELRDADIEIPIGGTLSRNRRFNCITCPDGIDRLASLPPYVIVCR